MRPPQSPTQDRGWGSGPLEPHTHVLQSTRGLFNATLPNTAGQKEGCWSQDTETLLNPKENSSYHSAQALSDYLLAPPRHPSASTLDPEAKHGNPRSRSAKTTDSHTGLETGQPPYPLLELGRSFQISVPQLPLLYNWAIECYLLELLALLVTKYLAQTSATVMGEGRSVRVATAITIFLAKS